MSPLPDTGVYRMFEGYLLNPDREGNGSTFSRIVFGLPQVKAVVTKGAGAREVPGVRISLSESVAFPPFNEVIASARIDDAASGCQRVWFVRDVAGSIFLERLSLDEQEVESQRKLVRETYPLNASWVRSVAGEAVLATGDRVLLLAGVSNESVMVGAFDLSSGRITGAWPLTGSIPGSIVGSWLLTRDFDTWLFVTLRTVAGLSTVALAVRSLQGASIPPSELHFFPVLPVAADSGVDGALARMVPTSGSQQLVLACVHPDGAPFVVMQGFDGTKPAQLALATVDTSFAKPRSKQYRVTCADLDNNGVEELVVGYAADYGGVSGVAALVLFRLDADTRRLEATSRYVAAGPSGTPLTSKDLKLGSGILGDAVTSGVFVLGAGGDFSHIRRGEVQIFAGIVPVNPVTLRFPPYTEIPATLPSATQIAVTGLKAPGILGSVADLLGLSVTLGAPKFAQRSSRGQLLAILQVPPYDRQAVAMQPSLSFSESDSRVKGLSVSSSKDWMLSVDAGINVGLDSSSLSFQASNSYGEGFSKMEDESVTTGVQISRTPTSSIASSRSRSTIPSGSTRSCAAAAGALRAGPCW